jgi:hypothetical protein
MNTDENSLGPPPREFMVFEDLSLEIIEYYEDKAGWQEFTNQARKDEARMQGDDIGMNPLSSERPATINPTKI